VTDRALADEVAVDAGLRFLDRGIDVVLRETDLFRRAVAMVELPMAAELWRVSKPGEDF
jgi:hypothetical protein